MNRKLIEQKALDIQQEISIMKSLQHPNILRLYDVIDDPKVNKVYLITEFCQQGDLMTLIQASDLKELQSIIKTDISSDDVLRRISFEIMNGLFFLHQNNIVHNDLKPSNILISRDGTVKLADFGVSQTRRVRLDFAGTPLFQAPEVVQGYAHDGRAADVYSLGATIFCIKFKKPPFRAPQGGNNNLKLRILHDQIINAPLQFPDDVDVDDQLKDLISRLMCKDEFKRTRLKDALQHPWVQTPPNPN